MKTLAEDLLLLALDDDKGTVSWRHATALPYGLGAALLMDLVLLERISSVEKKIVVLDQTPTGDEVLDAALEKIRVAGEPQDAKHWVKRLGDQKGLKEQLAERLVARGILREQESSLLWVFHSERFPTIDPGPESSLRDGVRAVALANVEPDARTLMLLSLINACHLTDSVFSGEERKQAEHRIKELAEGEQFGQAVGKVIAELAAAAAAVSAAAFSVTVAPGAHH